MVNTALVVASQICEILRNSPKNRTYSSSRSSKVIDLGVNRKRICVGIVSSGNAWERRSQSYFASVNSVPRNAIVS